MGNVIQAEVTICLENKIEKTEEMPEITRLYRFSMAVGAPWEEALAFSKEMTSQIETMQAKSKEVEKAREEREKENNVDVEDTSVENTSVDEGDKKKK